MYYTREFAKLAGVTVRTLRYYDQIELLTPNKNVDNGTRLYKDEDLLRLQQILTFKHLGFSLDEIRALLDNPSFDVAESLRIQKDAIDQTIQRLQRVSNALEITLAHLDVGFDWEQMRAITLDLSADDKEKWTRRFFSEDTAAKIAARQAEFTPEQIAEATRAWSDLIEGFKQVRHLPPEHPNVQILAAEYLRLLEGFTGGDPEIQAGLNRMYSNMENVPQAYRMYDADLQVFMYNAIMIFQEERKSHHEI